MKSNRLLPLLLLGTCTLTQALTEEGEKAANELIATLKEESQIIAEAAPDSSRLQNAQAAIRQIQSAISKGNDTYLEQALDNLEGGRRGEKTTASINKLKEALRNGRARKLEEAIERLEAQSKSISQKCLSATSPADLDGLIEELASRSGSSSYDSDEYRGASTEQLQRLRQLNTRIGYARSFVSSWQSYLQSKKTGNTGAAIQSLQSIISNESSFIPRSEVLDRLEKEKPDPDEILNTILEIRGLPEMQPALKKIANLQKNLRSSDSYGSSNPEWVQSLGRLEKTYREFLAGLPVNLDLYTTTTEINANPAAQKIADLRAELIKLVLPTYLNLPKDQTAQPGESVLGFLDRQQAEAKSRGDMALAQRIIDLKRLQLRVSNLNNTDITAIQEYNAAQNQIQAGQPFLAALSLQRALSRGSDLLPNTLIGEQLAAIKKDHPEDFDRATTEFLNPKPIPAEFPFGPSRYPDYFRGRYPEGDPRSQSGLSVTLPVPTRESPPPDKPQNPPTPPEKK